MNRADIIQALNGMELDKSATYNIFLSSMGIGIGPYALDGTGSYCHDDKLHYNNHVAPKQYGK